MAENFPCSARTFRNSIPAVMNSCGDDFHDAMHMASDCLRICVEEYRREGRPLPEPCGEETARKRVTYALAEIGFVPDGEITYLY